MKKLGKSISLLLVFTMVLGGFALAAGPAGILDPVKPAINFPDVPQDAWYRNNLNTLVRAGGINGMEDGRFHGDDGLQLCQFVKILVELMYPGEVDAWADYKVDGAVTWYSKYVGLANDKNLLGGITVNKSTLEAPMSRYTMAVIICNTASTWETLSAGEGIEYLIGDYPNIPPQYRDAVCRAYQAGILTGKDSAGNFQGNDGLTRAEACAVAIRLFDTSARRTMTYQVFELISGYHVAVIMPVTWLERYTIDTATNANQSWITFNCKAGHGSFYRGLLFSVVLSRTTCDFPQQDYMGKVGDYHVYLYYPSDVQFDPDDANYRDEYISMCNDLMSGQVSMIASYR